MSYVVSARKYRPRTFEEVIGQDHITSTLKNALLADKLAHAFLFCGPRGVGKTTCARLLAKVINMPDPQQAVKDGSYADIDIDISMNIIELDAASNNSVEHIRTLTEQVRFQPQNGKYKVFIIDEVHMLSQSAFNAFLKTLEEPPPYAIFILATTEKHKILPTILSRCQLYDFRRIQVPQIIEQLALIAAKEGMTCDEDALYAIAEKADGAMRDALSIFDRVASASQNKITYKEVVKNLNLLDFEYYFNSLNFILAGDSSEMLLLLDSVLSVGFEGDIFMNGLSRHLRNLLYCKQEKTIKLIHVSNQLKKLYAHQSQAISYSSLMTFLHLANECDVKYPKAKDKRLHIEIALLKMCYAGRVKERTLLESSTAQKKTTLEKVPANTVPAAENSDPTKNKSENLPSEEVHEIMDIVDSEPEDEVKLSTSLDQVKKGLLDTPVLSSIEALLQEAEVEIKTQNGDKKELVLKEAQSIWNDYATKSVSPTTTAIIDQAVLRIEDQQLKVYVPTNIAKEEIQQEAQLYSELREHFNQNDLIVDVVVDRKLFPDSEQNKPKKLYTTKEKYDYLVKVNPLLQNLVEELKLQPDQDA